MAILLPLAGPLAFGEIAPAADPTPLSVERSTRTDAVSFHREILPVLQAHCLPCHHRTSAKADLSLESPANILQGGDSGPAMTPGRADDSLVFKVAAHRTDPVMPPRGNQVRAANLTPRQLGLLALWIDQGAPSDVAFEASIAWQSLADHFTPALAVAVSPDNQFTAVGRANRIHFYHLPSRSLVARLTDPSIPGAAAQRDIVGALAFSPDGALLAAAGYREIRLWRRQDPLPEPFGPSGEPSAVAVSPDTTRVALALTHGEVLLLDTERGSVLRLLSSLSPPPDVLQFAPDGQRLAGANRQGTARIWSLDAPEPDRNLTVPHAIHTMVWPQPGDRLVLIPDGGTNALVFSLPAGSAESTEPDSRLEGHTAPITAALDATALGAWLATASEDGTVRLWPTNRSAAPQVLDAKSSIHRLAVVPSRSTGKASGTALLAVTTREHGTHLWKPRANAPESTLLKGDPRLATRVRLAEHARALAQAELEFQKSALQQGTEAWTKATNSLAAAVEKQSAAHRALDENEKKLADRRQSKVDADREKDETSSRLKEATDRLDTATKAAQNARRAAEEAASRLVAAELAAAQALRTQSDLERVLAGLPATADENALAAARESAAAATRDAESRAKTTLDTRAAHAKALDRLASRMTAAGEAKAAADRAKTELSARLKQIDERLKADTKAIADLDKQLARDRIARDTATADFELALRNETNLRIGIEETRRALAVAEVGLIRTDDPLREIGSARDAAAAQAHTWIGTSVHGPGLATFDTAGRLVSWSIPDGEPLAAVDLPPFAQPVAILPDGTLLLSRAGGLARLAPFPTWTPAGALGSGAPGSPIADRINALAFSPDGRLLASGGGEPSRSGELKLWTVADRALARDFGQVHSDSVLALAFSPLGDFIASGGADRFLRLTEVATGKRVRDFEGHTHHVLAVAWTPDARTLASGGAEGTVKLWNRLTGERLKNIDGFGKEVTALTPLPGTRDFLAIAASGQARVFRPDGTQVRTLPAGSAFLHSLAIASDGTFALAGGDDGTVRLWSIADGRLLAELPPPTAVALSSSTQGPSDRQ